MIEIQCPVTGEVSAWRDDHALQLHSLARQFQIPMEHVFAMAKVTAEMGPEWLEDSVEFYEGWLQDLTDNHVLKNGSELSISDLRAIRERARAGLELLLRHERNPAKRKWLERKLRPSAVWEENQKLARVMLAEKREKERR